MHRARHFVLKLAASPFWKSLFKNSFWALLGDSIASIVNLGISILIIRSIGSDAYGQFVIAQTYMYVMDVIFNIQSWQGVIHFGQKAITGHKKRDFHEIIKLGTIIDISTALIGGILSIIFASLIGGMFGWSQQVIACAQLFSYTIFSHFAGTPTGILRLMDKFDLVALQKFLSAAIKLVGILTLHISNGANLYIIVLVYVIGDIIGNVLLVVFAIYTYSKKYNIKETIFAKMPRQKINFIRYTFWSSLNSVVDLPVSYLDIFIVSYLGDSKVAIYKVFKQIIGIMQKATSPVQQSSLPQFTALSANRKFHYGFAVVKRIRSFILRVFTPIVVLVGASSPFWLSYIYGVDYASYWYILFALLSIQLLALSYTTIHPYFLALGKAKESTLYILIANIVYIGMAFLLIRVIGLAGMVVAFGVQVALAIWPKYQNIQKTLKSTNNNIKL